MIGIYGGTFNPVHYGHLRTALEMRQMLGLKVVRMLINHLPPHRTEPAVSAEMRYEMLSLAIEGREGLVADRSEIDRKGRSYMFDTLTSFRQSFPGQSLVLIVGVDAFLGIKTWYRWEELFELCNFAVMTRPGFDQKLIAEGLKSRMIDDVSDLKGCFAGKFILRSVTRLEISATLVREIVSKGGDPSFLLPDNVIAYIQRHNLYSCI